jgi:hypothetical protein
LIMIKEVVVFALTLLGFTDAKGEGIYMGYTDEARPDLTNRPSDGTFWSGKYTPIWLSRKRKEEKEEPEKDQRRE